MKTIGQRLRHAAQCSGGGGREAVAAAAAPSCLLHKLVTPSWSLLQPPAGVPRPQLRTRAGAVVCPAMRRPARLSFLLSRAPTLRLSTVFAQQSPLPAAERRRQTAEAAAAYESSEGEVRGAGEWASSTQCGGLLLSLRVLLHFKQQCMIPPIPPSCLCTQLTQPAAERVGGGRRSVGGRGGAAGAAAS